MKYPGFTLITSLLVGILNLFLTNNLYKDSECVVNRGFAFGLSIPYLAVLSFLIISILLVVYIRTKSVLRYNILAIGILGLFNLLERVLRGYICDYIDIFFLSVNLVDILIVGITLISLIYIFRKEYEDRG